MESRIRQATTFEIDNFTLGLLASDAYSKGANADDTDEDLFRGIIKGILDWVSMGYIVIPKESEPFEVER